MTRKDIGVLLLLVVLCAVVAIASPQFLSVANLQNVARLVGTYGIFSIGVGIVVITGGIDLSVGSICALLGVLLSMMLLEWGWPAGLALPAVIALGAGLGAVHGLLVGRLRLQPFIVTLCGLLLYRGAARYVAGDSTKGFGTGEGFEWLRTLAAGNLAGVPMPFVIMVVVAAVAWVLDTIGVRPPPVRRGQQRRGCPLLRRKNASRHRERLCGRRHADRGLGRDHCLLHQLGFTGIARQLLPALCDAAAVVGGCSLRGGEGTVLGIVLGTALLQVLRNMVNLLDVPSSLDFAVMGAVILIGAVADEVFGRRKRRAA